MTQQPNAAVPAIVPGVCIEPPKGPFGEERRPPEDWGAWGYVLTALFGLGFWGLVGFLIVGIHRGWFW